MIPDNQGLLPYRQPGPAPHKFYPPGMRGQELPERKQPPAIPFATALRPPRASARMSALKFLGGLFAGFGMTGLYVLVASKSTAAGVLLIVCKLSLGITCLCYGRWRFLGAGLLTSMALAALIFGAGLAGLAYAIYTCKGW